MWQKLVHQQLHHILIRQRLHCTGIIEVAGQDRPLGRLASPERPFVRLYTDVLATDIRLYTDVLATDIGSSRRLGARARPAVCQYISYRYM